MLLKRIHYVSAILLSLFICVHLVNHALLVKSIANHLAFMKEARKVYRQPVVEMGLIAAALTQAITGLRLVKRTNFERLRGFKRLKVWSGIYLAFFLAVHLVAVFAGRYLLHLDTNVYYAAADPSTHPYALFFVPYYAFSVIAIFGHVASIHAEKMRKPFFGLTPRLQSFLILLAGFLLSVAILYQLVHAFSEANIPKAYYKVFGR